MQFIFLLKGGFLLTELHFISESIKNHDTLYIERGMPQSYNMDMCPSRSTLGRW